MEQDAEVTAQIPTLVLEQLNGDKKGTQINMDNVPDFVANTKNEAANAQNRAENQKAKDELSSAVSQINQTTENAVKKYQSGALTDNKL